MPSPLCFVLMPFGRKSSPIGGIIDFDAVYLQIITPAIVGAALDPIHLSAFWKIRYRLRTILISDLYPNPK